jgi:uncharacterized protein
MRITLVLTHQCNLACTYCYTGTKFSKQMPEEIAWKALRMAFQTDKSEPLTVSYFGGEPLLEFDSMVRWTRLVHQMAVRSGREIEFSVTTNATIVSDKILNFFEHYPFHVAWSVDGLGHDHDRFRPFVGGRSSSSVVWRNLEKVGQKLRRTSIHLVVNPANVAGITPAVKRLVELGFHDFTLLPNMEADWSANARQAAHESYFALAEFYWQSVAAGMQLNVSPFIAMEGRSSAKCQCGFGVSDVAVSPGGNLYPCARLVGTDDREEVRLGDVQTGVSLQAVRDVRARVRARMVGCGVDSPCGCVSIMPGDTLLQMRNTSFFGDLTEQVWNEVALAQV